MHYDTGECWEAGMDGTGEVIVGHPEALWQVVSDLEIGVDDLGVLTIDDQARVESKSGFLGRKGGANGNLFVLRNGLWRIENQLRIAEQGKAAMILSQGGKVELEGGPLQLATSANAEGWLSIELPGSTLTATNSACEISRSGQASVQILRGGALHVESADGDGPHAAAHLALVAAAALHQQAVFGNPFHAFTDIDQTHIRPIERRQIVVAEAGAFA